MGGRSGRSRRHRLRTPLAFTSSRRRTWHAWSVAQLLGTASSEGGPYLICDLEAYRSWEGSDDEHPSADGARAMARIEAGYRLGATLAGSRSNLILADFGPSVVSVYRAGSRIVIADSVAAPPGTDPADERSYLEVDDVSLLDVPVTRSD